MIRAFGITNKGMKRSNNEDNFLINNSFNLYLVADGMGGHQGGEYSSGLALKTVEEVFYEYLEDPEATVPDLTDPDEVIKEKFRYAVQLAGRKIFEMAKKNAELRGMGTTFSGLVIGRRTIFIAHIGDSRVYLFRDGELNQLTEDHTLIHEQIKAGHLKNGEMKSNFLKSILTRSLGYQEDAEIDFFEIPEVPGDLFLLCSDGLTNMVSNDEIKRVLDGCDLKAAAKRLVRMANENGGDDNITVVLVRIEGEGNGYR